MKRLLWLLILFVPLLAHGQGCVRCKIGLGCTGNVVGGCECDDGSGVCATCGICSGGGCHQNCPFLLNVLDTKDIRSEAWWNNKTLGVVITQAHPELGKLYVGLQDKMVRTGKYYLTSGTIDNYEWNAYRKGDYLDIELVGDSRLEINGHDWAIYKIRKHWFDQQIAKGTYR